MSTPHATAALAQVLTEEQYAGRTSAVLLAAYQSDRDEEAFRALVRRYGGMVLRTCRAILFREDLAGEAFQETFARLAVTPLTSERPGAVVTWLRRSARRFALNVLRRERRRATHEAHAPAGDATPSPVQTALGGELREQVASALSALPERFRLPIELAYFDGLTHAEVAAALGCPKGTVDSNISRGLDRLKGLLKDMAAPAAALATVEAGTRAAVAAAAPAILSAARAIGPGAVGGWLAGKLAAAVLAVVIVGVGVVLSARPAPPVVPPAAVVSGPAAEPLADRNRRLFDERVKPALLAALAPMALGGGPVEVVELAAFDSRVRVMVEARHATPLPGYPPTARSLFVYDTADRRVRMESTLNPQGHWRPVDPDKPVVWFGLKQFGLKLESKPTNAAAAMAAFELLPADDRAPPLRAERERRLRDALTPYLGEWVSDAGRHRVEFVEPLGLRLTTGDKLVREVTAEQVWRCEPGTPAEPQVRGLLQPIPVQIDLTDDGRRLTVYGHAPWRRP